MLNRNWLTSDWQQRRGCAVGTDHYCAERSSSSRSPQPPDADGARDAADGLRNDIERVRTEAAQSHTACIERADAISELLGAVEAAGRSMAQAADLHASDVKTLMDAWPKD